MATHIKTNGEVREVLPNNGKCFSLRELQKYVDGIIEIIDLPNGKQMVANETGKLTGLPKNEKATEIWKKEYPIEVYDFNNDELIVGDVLIATPEELGDDTEEECDHEWTRGRCEICGEIYEAPDFSGATPGDR